MDEAFVALIDDYVEETLPLASEVMEALLALEQAWTRGSEGEEAVRSIKSNLHSIKGNSGMMGFIGIRDVAHVLEDLAALVVATPAARTARTMNVLLEGADLAVELIQWVKENQRALEGDGADELLARARLFADRARRAEHAITHGRAQTNTLPPPGARPTPPPEADEFPAPATPAAAPPTMLVPAPLLPPAPPPPPSAAAAAADSAAVETTVRVPFGQVDELLDLVSELVITQSALVQVTHELADDSRLAAEVLRLDQHATTMGRNVKAMQSRLLRMRMLPMSTLFARYTRFVRELSIQRGQRITLMTAGGDTPIDKTIIERLGEPLTHMINNAIAHGIEPPEERRKAGKPEEGTIRLEASVDADHVLLTVADDGKGLDLERIREKARGLGWAVDGLNDAEVRRLIFAPGFSTQAEVTALAGRGVGLDVVENRILAMGGYVDVESERGRGTTFLVHLPLTLSVMRGLLVRIGAGTYIMPMLSVMETVRVADSDLHEIDRRGVLTWRGRLAPVVDTPRLLHVRDADPVFCLLVGTTRRAYGVLVDDVLGAQDIVVKPIDPAAEAPSYVSGATILGDGRVVLILDPMRMARVAFERGAPAATPAPSALPSAPTPSPA